MRAQWTIERAEDVTDEGKHSVRCDACGLGKLGGELVVLVTYSTVICRECVEEMAKQLEHRT